MRFLLVIIAMLFMDAVVLAQTTITTYYKDFDWVAMRPIGKKVNKKDSHYPIKVLMSQDSNILEVQYLKYRKVEFDQSRRNYPYFKRVIGHNTYLPIYRTNIAVYGPGQYLIPINDTMTLLYGTTILIVTKSKRFNTLSTKALKNRFINREVTPVDFYKDYPRSDIDTTIAWRKENAWWNLDKLQYIKESFSNMLSQLKPTDIYFQSTYSYKNGHRKRVRITSVDSGGSYWKEYKLPMGSLFKDGSLFNYSIFSGAL